MIDRLRFFLDFTEGGAWSFLVRGVIRLVNSVNERDLNLLIKVQGLPPVVRRFVGEVYTSSGNLYCRWFTSDAS